MLTRKDEEKKKQKKLKKKEKKAAAKKCDKQQKKAHHARLEFAASAMCFTVLNARMTPANCPVGTSMVA